MPASERVCALDPADADVDAAARAFARLSRDLMSQGRDADAAMLLQAALLVRPAQQDARAALALAWSRAGEHAKAREQFEAVLSDAMPGTSDTRLGTATGTDPVTAPAPDLAGLPMPTGAAAPPPAIFLAAYARTLTALDCAHDALGYAERAVELAPHDAAAHVSRGDALAALHRHFDALGAYQRAAGLDPQSAAAHAGIGRMFIELGRPMAALQALGTAAQLAPDDAAIPEAIATAFGKGGKPQQALPWLERALALEPRRASALRQMGNVLAVMRLEDAALACFEAARRARPDWSEAWLEEAGVLLRRGDYARGWRAYGKREAQRMLETQPSCWSGDEPLDGKRILLVAEQGLGDTIQFGRYAPLVAQLAGHTILEVQKPLAPLFAEVAADWGVEVIARGDDRPDTDHQCLLLSLPRAFRTSLRTVPADVPYLRTPPSRREAWRARLDVAVPRRDGRVRVGLASSGNPQFKGDGARSIPLAVIEPLFALPGIDWVLTQPDVRDNDRPVLERHPEIHSFAPYLHDFTDTAALVDELDLVIACDTSVAHLAGALARPLWLLLPFMPDWRWMHDRADTPWYRTARLFRQQALNDWGGVIERVRDALASMLESRSV